ncbi:ectoine/hydroxyectoine ABC transporter substrate-binding protein EhuB [Myceligenerans halotolerans]
MALRRKKTLVALTAVGALTLAGCGGGDDPGGEGGDGEVLTIGIANEQPYGFMDADGNATGFAPDVAREVLSNLGYGEPEFEVVEFGNLIGGLQAQQFDMIAAGMYINEERLAQIQFSDPDYCTSESLAVPEGNPEGVVDYSSFADNSDLTIAVASGTVEVGYAEEAGIGEDQIKSFPGIDQMYQALEAGEVDAVTGTAATVNGQIAGREGLESVEPFFPKDAEGNETLPCGGYGFRLDDTEFRDEFNAELNTLREDGTTMEIITSYEGFDDSDVELANDLTVADFEE